MVDPHKEPPERHDWEILDALSDDYESVEQIANLVHDVWPSVTPLDIINRLERLYDAGYVTLTRNVTFDRAEMIREIDHTSDRRFWFGRTASGDALWERHAEEFCAP